VHNDLENGFQLHLKRFDRIGFGRRGVLDAEDQVDAWRAGMDETGHATIDRIVDAHLLRDVAAKAAEPLGYTRAEDVQALCVNLLARWNAAGLLDRLRRLESAAEFTIEGKIPETLRVALDEARATIDR